MSNRLLLVEGLDDQHVMWSLFKAHALPECFQVVLPRGDGGVDELFRTIPVRLKQSGLERMGIVLDADEAVEQRWHTMYSILQNNGFLGVPDHPSENGTVVTHPDGLSVGVWIMPDNSLPGMLESFLAFLVPPGDALLPLVDDFLGRIPPEHVKYSPNRAAKARIHAWLAVQSEPGKPLGQSITAKYLDAHAPIVNRFLGWLKAILID